MNIIQSDIKVSVKTTTDPDKLAQYIGHEIQDKGQPSNISFSTCGVVEILYSVLMIWY